MANHCYNHISIEGHPTVIKTLYDNIRRVENLSFYKDNYHLFFSIDHEVPRPTDVKDFDPYEAYGSKWFEFDMDFITDHILIINGDSAWSPMIALCEKISFYYEVDVNISYEESGSDIGGYHYYTEGILQEFRESTYAEHKFIEEGMDFLNNELEIWVENYELFIDWVNDYKDVVQHLESSLLREFSKSFIELKNKSN